MPAEIMPKDVIEWAVNRRLEIKNRLKIQREEKQYLYFMGQKCIHDPVKNTLTMTIQKTFSNFWTRFVESVGVNDDIITFVLGKNYNLHIILGETKEEYSISPEQIGNFKRSNENTMLRNGIKIHIFPMTIFDKKEIRDLK